MSNAGNVTRMLTGAVLALCLFAASPLAQVRPVPPVSAGSAAWGGIAGTLSAQTDLQAALDAKAALAGDVTFASVSVGTAPFADGAFFRLPANGTYSGALAGLAADGMTSFDIITTNVGNTVFIGASDYDNVFRGENVTVEADALLTLDGGSGLLITGGTVTVDTTVRGANNPLGESGFEFSELWADALFANSVTATGAFDLNPTTDLTINGTPGVSATGYVKGLLTDAVAAAEAWFDNATLRLPNASLTPAVSNTSANSCGTTAATIAGNNNVGTITVGATAGTSCTMTFTITAPVQWVCMVNNATTANLARATPGSATTSVFAGTFSGGDTLNYVCIPR